MSSVARRYAKALFGLAQESSSLEQCGNELASLAAWANDPEIHNLLDSPLLSASRRNDLAQTFARELKLSDLLTRFVRLLADQQRLGSLPMIQRVYQRLVEESLGQVSATIRTASPLDKHQENALIATFSKITGKQVQATISVDPEILGGVVVEVGGRVYDGSVRTQLNRLAKQVAGTVSL